MGKTYEALTKSMPENVLEIFQTKDKHDARSSADDQTDLGFSSLEGFEMLKTNFLTRYPGQSVKTILFSGVSDGSGASTLAAGFAAGLAKDSNTKVLLIDANFRRPNLHRLFEMPINEGLFDLLNKKEQMAFEIRRKGNDHLYVLTSGGTVANPTQLFKLSRFQRFIEKVRSNLDYVIIDSPSALAYPDAQMICPKLDGVVLVVEAGKTKRPVALRAKKIIEDAGGRILGTILNKREYYIPEWLYKRI